MNLNPQKTVFLIDGSAFLYRAYYGTRPLHTPQGVPVQAVYSFCRMIKKLMDTFNPHYIAIVWDSKGKTTRHEMFEDYKATRQAPPSDLFDQKKLIVEFAELIGMRQIAKQGIEADDIMFSLAKERSKDGDMVVFVTSDKDMAQALDANTIIFDPYKDEFLDVAAFEKKRGFPVEKLPFYFAILGDASDNIPGVKGIGEKGAADLVKQFDSLQSMYAQLDKVSKERTRKLLEEQINNAFLSEKLFLLQYNPTELSKQDLQFDSAQWKKAAPLFQELDFKSLLKGMDDQLVKGVLTAEEKIQKMSKYRFICVTTEKQLEDVCFKIKDYKAFAIDTEGTGLNPLEDEIIGISICVQEGESYYIPFGHKTNDQQLSQETIIAALKPLFEDSAIKKYMHHAKFDELYLTNLTIMCKEVTFDTCLAANLVNKDWQSAGLKELSFNYFDEPMLTFKEVVIDNKYKDFSYVPLELAALYAAVDAHQTFKLKKVLEHDLKKEKLFELFETIEMPISQILFKMEHEGIYCDVSILKKLDAEIVTRLHILEQEILGLIGEHNFGINLNSPKQVEDLLFRQLQLPPQKKSAKGSYSTDQEVLEALSKFHPVPGLISRWRELAKLKNTYIDALPEYINLKTGKIHTTFSQTQVATGRLASSDPNLQNIPVNSYGIRAAFKPEEGNIFLSADYSQIELRVLAHLSEDQNLINAFLKGLDIHAQTASGLFDVSVDQVTNEQRQIGKRINFSILYGLTPFGLSKDLDISMGEAKTYIDKYFAQYPKVNEWMAHTIEYAKKNGYVTTYWGRRRYVSGIYEKNKNLYEEARRIAINTVVQGTAAEIMKQGMIVLEKNIALHNLGAKMILQIHDELLISVPESEKETTAQIVKQTLENVVQWKIPLEVTTRFGKDWDEVTK